MVSNGEGSSRGVPRHRRRGGGAGEDVGTVERNVRQTGNEELAQVAGSCREIQSSDGCTTPSIKNQGVDATVGMEKLGAGEGLGFRVEDEEEEEVGVKRLLKKAACVYASQLSQLETEINKQDQEHEVIALQAIYDSDCVLIDVGSAGLPAFMINVHLEIPEGIKVVAEAPQPFGCDGISVSTSDDDNSFIVQALPPISLLCVFPPTYPSHSAPLFELTCLWLSSKKLSTLCTWLDNVWEETSPGVVVFTWSNRLQSETLPLLGATEKFELEPDFEKRDGRSSEGLDQRAVSGSESSDVDIFRLLRYNEEFKNKKFLESLHTCYICFSDQPGFSFTRLPCQHHFCKSCMQQFCNTHVKDGNVVNITCPDVSCKESVPPRYLRALLDKGAFERWDELLLQKTLDSMPDVVYCPKCSTPSIEDPDHLVQCSKCRFSFCSLCMANWHPGQNCMTPEARLRILQGRRKGRALGEEALRQEKELINEVLDMDYIKKEAKQCPTCRMAVQKSEGCNKMTCTNCGGYFCFQCGQSIRGYDHFKASSTCVLLDQIEINRWELQFNLQLQQLQEQQLVPQNYRGAEGNAAARPCPNCKQVNYKDRGNNHIFCWACQNHYCGLCNKMVRRGAGHFGINKCKQHTAD